MFKLSKLNIPFHVDILFLLIRKKSHIPDLCHDSRQTRVRQAVHSAVQSGGQKRFPAPDINGTSADISLYLNSSKKLNQAKYNAENVRQTKSLLDDIQPLKHF